MKSMDIKRVGTVAVGALMLGAAVAGPVTASIDMTGVDKGFFYDDNFNPIVQIVVGEKGMATDAVAAGNIAAAIGNLAYTSTTKTVSPEFTPEGQVIISTSAVSATGDYIQDEDASLSNNFYDEDDGLYFDGTKTYEKGDFTQYALACDQQERSEAALLMEGTYNNIHCLFCQTLCINKLKNPAHEMKEKITINSSKMKYYEDGLQSEDTEALKMEIEKGAITYTVETGYIPMEDFSIGTDSYVDFEYRGQIIFMGNEYYVKDIDGTKIYLAPGKVLDDITSEGYTSEYNGYKFKIDHLIYSGEYTVAGILLDVQKPDGTIVQTQISKMANGQVDNLEISGVYAEAAGAVETASIIVYDTSQQVVLKDGSDLELGGVKYDGWRVEFTDYEGNCSSFSDCDISDYENYNIQVLEKIVVTLNKNIDGVDALGVDESLNFPSNFMLTFKGYLTSRFRESSCSGGDDGIVISRGDYPYQMLISFTADDRNRYDNVRMDEGPFSEGDTFILDGTVQSYDKYEFTDKDTDKEDYVEVTIKPLISGNKRKIKMYRLCDPDGNGANGFGNCTAGNGKDTHEPTCNCTGFSLVMRQIALIDAMDDDDTSKFENDKNVTLDPTDIFWAQDTSGTIGDLYMFWDDSDKTLTFATSANDTYITVEPNMVSPDENHRITAFDVHSNALSIWVQRESGFTSGGEGVNADGTYNSSLDLNNDVNSDDLLVIKKAGSEYVVIDMTDRSYNGGSAPYTYKNSVKLYSNWNSTNGTVNQNSYLISKATLDEDVDTLLITPTKVNNQITADWGIDYRLDEVKICHPQDYVYSTYFIGTSEEESTLDTAVTKDDVGTSVTAGCCTFTVSAFNVTVAGTETSYTESTVNKIVGHLVVPEVGADTTKNLIIVGGPVVNGMCTVTKEDIEAETDKFIVKRDGNLLIVAGYEAEDTLAAGDALIDWLYANVH